MAIPPFSRFTSETLRLIADEKPRTIPETCKFLTKLFNLTEEEASETIGSGTQTKVYSRVNWSFTYLKDTGFAETITRGLYKITPAGKAIAGTIPDDIDKNFLIQKSPLKDKLLKNKEDASNNKKQEKVIVVKPQESETEFETPLEKIEAAQSELKAALIKDVLNNIKNMDAFRFEQLVVDLMLKLGYGGSRKEAGRVTQKTGDGGIDGIIQQDRLGLDSIYLQAKRWNTTVGRPEIQAFAGALDEHQANKGVFITTSDYSSQAEQFVSKISKKIILIDGETLAELMVENDLGVSIQSTVFIKKIDSDYFTE